MKLLMVSHYFESHRGGIEIVAGQLARALGRLGNDVIWLATDATPPPAGTESFTPVAVRAINTSEKYLGLPFPVPTPGALLRIYHEVYWADAVLLHDTLYPTSFATFAFAYFVRKPVIIIAHVGAVPYRNPLLRSIMSVANRVVARPLLARCDRVAFISEITARYFSEVPFRSPPVLILNGVDPGIFSPVSPDQKQKLRRDLGFALDRTIALFVGRFVEKKGLDILSRMARLRPDIIWAFAGWGHLDPCRWGLTNVIVFSGLRGISLTQLYRASDLFVLPSKGEGFPLVIQEALACGLPVVCSAETAGADTAASRFLSPVPMDQEEPDAAALAFCQEIDRVLAGDGSTRISSEERFRFVSARYCWTDTARRYVELIRPVLARTP